MKKFVLVIIVLFLVAGCKTSVVNHGNNTSNFSGSSSGGPTEGIAIKSDKTKKQIKGSCNAINETSTCLEYIGSYWTEEEMKKNCNGIFSTDDCPKDFLGGCRTGIGTILEILSWTYPEKEGDFDPEVLENAQKNCESLDGAEWSKS